MDIKEYEKRKTELFSKMELAEDEETVNSIGLELKKLDIHKNNTQTKSLQTEDENGEAFAQSQGFQFRGSSDDNFKEIKSFNKKSLQNDENMEYRLAFKEYLTKGKQIPKELRDNTLTGDIQSVIPKNIVNKIIEKMEMIGFILPMVTKTAFSFGISYPVAGIRPIAQWVGEGEKSKVNKLTTTEIVFTQHKLRIEISMSAEAYKMSIDAFERYFIETVSVGMVKAIEKSIISGKGDNSPKGILVETPENDKIINFTTFDYKTLMLAEGALPDAYSDGTVWFTSRKFFYDEMVGMVDATGQPIARVNKGLDGKEEAILLGRKVILGGDYLQDTPDVKAFLYKFSDYSLNKIYDLGIMAKDDGGGFDWETEDRRIKAVQNLDGKCLDINSLIILKSGNGGKKVAGEISK